MFVLHTGFNHIAYQLLDEFSSYQFDLDLEPIRSESIEIIILIEMKITYSKPNKVSALYNIGNIDPFISAIAKLKALSKNQITLKIILLKNMNKMSNIDVSMQQSEWSESGCYDLSFLHCEHEEQLVCGCALSELWNQFCENISILCVIHNG